MAAIDTPCVAWTTEEAVYEQPGTRPADHEQRPVATALAIDIASAWLWRLSGRRFSGACEVTVRPVGRGCGNWSGPALHGDLLWFDSASGRYGLAGGDRRRWDDPGNEGVSEIALGFYPVRSVEAVMLDGVAFHGYRVDDARTLVRIDGNRWPAWQDLTLADTEAGTWSVRLFYGDDPPADGAYAATVLAAEILKSNDPNGKCRLGPRVTNVTRQGVSAVVFDPMALIERGRFGIPEIDAFLSSVNPYGLAERAQVFSPDVPRAVRRTSTVPGS